MRLRYRAHFRRRAADRKNTSRQMRAKGFCYLVQLPSAIQQESIDDSAGRFYLSRIFGKKKMTCMCALNRRQFEARSGRTYIFLHMTRKWNQQQSKYHSSLCTFQESRYFSLDFDSPKILRLLIRTQPLSLPLRTVVGKALPLWDVIDESLWIGGGLLGAGGDYSVDASDESLRSCVVSGWMWGESLATTSSRKRWYRMPNECDASADTTFRFCCVIPLQLDNILHRFAVWNRSVQLKIDVALSALASFY